MKKTMMIIAVFVSVMGFIACGDDTCDKDAVKSRIESLEDAINANDVSQFLDNVSSDTNQFNTFSQANLDALTDTGATNYDFHDYDVSCDGEDDADVTCTATITPGGNEQTSFTLVNDGDWYVYLWEEGDPAVVMYDKYSVAK